ncbi:MAG: hypothetical protein JNN09_04760 [Alphaproteobacteria bacterium]|nr:hypothetical protein [Alphaproteobacteria bacterium]
MRFFFPRDLLKAASFLVFLVTGPVQADDQVMNLFPKQRASHQEQVDSYAAHYQERGQAYVDHMYATGGEEPMEPDTLLVGELKDESIDTVPIDTGEVADLVKQAEDKGIISEDGTSPTESSVKEKIPPREGTPVPVGEPKKEDGDKKEVAAPETSQDVIPAPSPNPVASPSIPDSQNGAEVDTGKGKETEKEVSGEVALPTPSTDGAVPATDLVSPPASSPETSPEKPSGSL